MAAQPFDYQQLLQIIELIESSSQFSEFKLRSGDLEIELRRGGPGAAMPVMAAPAAVATPMAQAPAPAIAAAVPGSAPPAAAAPVKAARAAVEHLPGQTIVTAPMVGTFYRAPEPGAAPFVEVGKRVDADTPVCIVEVMKLMSTIPAGTAGVVVEILAADAEPVEYGQPLFVIAAERPHDDDA